MLKWHTPVTVVVIWWLWLVVFALPAQAANWVCSEDLDGDGDIDAVTETASCTAFGADQFCPLNSEICIASNTDICPTDGFPCLGGVCEPPAPCEHQPVPPPPAEPELVISRCPTNPGLGFFVDRPRACDRACTTTQACIPDPALSYLCPSNPANSCHDTGPGGHHCNTNPCYDLEVEVPVDTEIPTDMLVNDGTTDGAGNCTALTYIFSGRPMDCDKPGVSTAFSNCCKETDTIYTDSLGTRAELELASAAVTGTFTAMSAAYSAYNAAIAGGATTAAAAETAATVATDAFIGAFDPTTLAISVAIALITEYLLSGCDQTDLETAALRSSGYCVEIGEYCRKEWFGGCVQKAKSHCCFNSKLARIVHEQGRPQLAEFAALAPDYFGAPEAPTCDGFTPAQFQSLDFSRIDLSEYYDDIATDAMDTIQLRIEEGANEYLDATGGG